MIEVGIMSDEDLKKAFLQIVDEFWERRMLKDIYYRFYR